MDLRFEDLAFDFPGRPVLQGVSALLAPGGLTAILGPNGAGKTTLLRLGLGLLAPASGRVLVGGKDAHHLTHADRSRLLSYVPQRADVSFAFTALEVVALGLYARGLSAREVRTRAHEALAQVHLVDRAQDPFAALSAGQQQRVTLARAMAQIDDAPRCLLADEPVSAMDPAHVLACIRLMVDLSRRHTLGVVLHDVSLVLQCASRVILLGPAGRLVASGPTLEALTPATLEAAFGVPFRAIPDPEHPGRTATFVTRDTLVA